MINGERPVSACSEIRGSAGYALTAVDAEQLGESYAGWITALEVFYIHNLDGEDIEEKCEAAAKKGRARGPKFTLKSAGELYSAKHRIARFIADGVEKCWAECVHILRVAEACRVKLENNESDQDLPAQRRQLSQQTVALKQLQGLEGF